MRFFSEEGNIELKYSLKKDVNLNKIYAKSESNILSSHETLNLDNSSKKRNSKNRFNCEY